MTASFEEEALELGHAHRPLLANGSNTSTPERSVSDSPRTSPVKPKAGLAWSAGLPASFICGALLTLAAVLLTGGSIGGLRWQGAPGVLQPGLLELRADGPAPVQANPAAQQAAASQAAAAIAAQCPKPQSCPTCKPCLEGEVQQQQAVKASAATSDAAPAARKADQQQQGKGQQADNASAVLPPPLRALRMPWSPLLAASEARRGVGYYGSGARLEAVVAKLLAGEPIRAYTLGGSVTRGSGASDKETMAYPARFFEFINKTFPHKDHVLVNKGVGATSSGIFSACAEHMLSDGADLVILEFTINEPPDSSYTEPQRRGYEQLIRKVLRMPGPPAVIQLHHYAWWRAAGDGVRDGLFYHPRAEAQLYVFSQYYDIPSVSMRSALHPLMRTHIDRFDIDKLVARHKPNISPTGYQIPGASEKDAWRYFYWDRTHPADQGHQVIAELLAHVVLHAAERVQMGGAAGAAAAGWAAERKDEALAQLPPPMIPRNVDYPSTLCAMLEDFKGVVKARSGFNYTPERPDEDSFVGQKWGWTANEPGAWAELEFDSRPDAEGAGQERAEVQLSHLSSYEGMGTASVACVSGCKCAKQALDGTWELQATLMQNLRFKVTPHAKCRVRVTVSDKPGAVKQKGHKVKLMAIMVSHFPLRLDQKEDQTDVVVSHVDG